MAKHKPAAAKAAANNSDPRNPNARKNFSAITEAHIVIDINMADFRNVLTAEGVDCYDRGTPYQAIRRVTPPGSPPPTFDVVQDPKGPVVVVLKPTPKLPFVINCLDATAKIPNPFFPVGISFIQRNPAPPIPPVYTEAAYMDLLGLDNFVKHLLEPTEHAIIVASLKKRKVKDRYDYGIIFQDGRSGAIGIIDPPIIHSSDDPLPGN